MSNTYDAATRNDALADALGIRKTPRKNVEDSKGRRSATRTQSRPSKSSTSNNANNNISLLSPLARNTNRTLDSGHNLMDGDASVDSVGRPPLLTMGPFASLHPKISMVCVYEESRITAEATRVFLTSNMEGSGRLSVCLLCPRREQSNPNTLRVLSLEGQIPGGYTITPEVSISCISAIAIESSPIAPPFHPRLSHRELKGQSAVDTLVLREDGGTQKLTLFRGSLPIVDCCVQSVAGLFDKNEEICDLEHSLSNRLDVVVRSNPEVSIRANVSLRIASGAVGEKILSTLESSVFSMVDVSRSERAEFAIKIRSDCVRLEQSLLATNVEDAGVEAVETVILALFQQELQRHNCNEEGSDKAKSFNVADSAWNQLLQTKFHKSYEMDCPDFLFQAPISLPKCTAPKKSLSMCQLSGVFSTSVDFLKTGTMAVAESFFRDLHFLYEDYKLECASRDFGMPAVGTVLGKLCRMGATVNSSIFLQHYRRDLGETWYNNLHLCTDDSRIEAERAIDIGQPFCIFSWIDTIISGEGYDNRSMLNIGTINCSCTRLKSLVRVYNALYLKSAEKRHADSREFQLARDFDVVRIMIEEGFTDVSSLRDSLSPGVALPLLEVLHRCRASHHRPGIQCEDPAIWSLIGRNDLRNNAELEKGVKNQAFYRHDNPTATLEDKDMDGLSLLEETSAMLFPDDNRVKEVGRLLRSSRPVYLSVPRAIEVSDHDYERLKQEKLLLLSRRILALPLGRGMVTIGNLKPVPAEPLPLPELCLVGRVPPTNALLALDTTDCPSDLKVWPDFNNGVAAGLRLPLEKDAGALISKITRTWIVYNRPGNQVQQNSQSPSSSNQNLGHAHGGLLMALGLRGHLTTLEMTDIFDYLTQGTVTTTVGVLLGMAAK